ncbi:MAG TPA: PAS domain S-box protein [Thermoleophilaceae bacterium]
MGDKSATAAPGGDVLERVLGSLLELSFVLTDRDGFVTRWTARAEQLLGLEGADAAGRPLMEAFGVSEDKTPAAGRVQVKAHHQDGEKFRAELTFIPVPMSHSLEFNGFLESLESDRPAESVRRRVNSQHSDVLDWIGSVVTDGVPLHSDELTAGTIVAFRALDEVPWMETGGDAAAPAKKSEAGLADAVDKAAEVLARSDELERTLDEAGEAVEEARAMADAAHEEASEAARRVSQMAEENVTLRSELDRAQSELDKLHTRLDNGAAPASSDELAQLRAEIASIREAPPAVTAADLEALRAEIHQLQSGDVGSEIEALRAEMRELRGAGEGGENAAERAASSLEAVRVLADELRAEVAEARDAAARAQESANEAADTAAVEAKVARVQAEAARVHSEEAGNHAAAAREVAEAWASAAEKHGRRASENGHADAGREEKPKQPERPLREARAGFDDAEAAMAVIGLDGRFQELNPRFSELVGYKEQDFQTASWPPVADRGKLDHHREQMRAMIAGEIESAEVNTGYVHAQGLLVPVAGTISVERDANGEPRQFLLSCAAP